MIRDYVSVDIETTGMNAKWNKIIEIGAVKVRNGMTTDTFSMLVNPGVKLSPFIMNLTGINDGMLCDRPGIEQVLPQFIAFAEDDFLLGHNIMFDYGFLKQNAINMNITFDKSGMDTLKISRKVLKNLESRKLDFLCNYYGIEDNNHHRALNDATVTSQLYLTLMDRFGDKYSDLFQPYKLIYTAKKMQPITLRQKKYLKDLMTKYHITPDFDLDKLTKNEASKKIDKILGEKGRIFD